MDTQILLGLLAFCGAIIAALLGLVGVLLRRNNRTVAGGSNNQHSHDHQQMILLLHSIEGRLIAMNTILEERLSKGGSG